MGSSSRSNHPRPQKLRTSSQTSGKTPCCSKRWPTRRTVRTPCRSAGVKRECRSGLQCDSASEMRCRHSSMLCCVKQFHGLADVTGWLGIIDRRTGLDTGVTLIASDAERRGVLGCSGDGGRRRAC
eukprot:scaffold34641_cov156-Amphora_coffeaeformis.AAC.4